jgi:hypothetical protein
MDLKYYDAYWQKEKPVYLRTLSMIAKKLEEGDMERVGEIVGNAMGDDSFSEEREKAREMFWANRGGAGAGIVDFMVNKVRQIEGGQA